MGQTLKGIRCKRIDLFSDLSLSRFWIKGTVYSSVHDSVKITIWFRNKALQNNTIFQYRKQTGRHISILLCVEYFKSWVFSHIFHIRSLTWLILCIIHSFHIRFQLWFFLQDWGMGRQCRANNF